MANYIVSDTDLTSIADAIRAKSGGSSQLAFPAGFVSEIGSIETGGGGGLPLEDVLNRSVTGDVDITVSNSWPGNANYMVCYNGLFRGCKISSLTIRGLTFVPERLADQTEVGTNGNQSVLTTVSMPNAIIAAPHAFNNCRALVSVSLPSLTTGFINYTNRSASMFANCVSLTDVDVGSLDYFSVNMFQNCTSLTKLDLKAPTQILAQAFNGASSLSTLIIRSSAVPTLANINAFQNTPFASGKAGGTLYVPSALIADYQAATNWSTILGYSTNSIAAIEGSEYE